MIPDDDDIYVQNNTPIRAEAQPAPQPVGGEVEQILDDMHGHLRAWAVNEATDICPKNAPHANATWLLKKCREAIAALRASQPRVASGKVRER